MALDLAAFCSRLPRPASGARVPSSEFQERIERVRAELRRRSLDAAYAFGTEYRPGDTGWLTGYDPHIEHAIVIVGMRRVLVLGSPDAMAYALETMRTGEFRCLAAAGIPDADYPGHAPVTLDEALREACGGAAHRVGVLTPDDVLTVD